MLTGQLVTHGVTHVLKLQATKFTTKFIESVGARGKPRADYWDNVIANDVTLAGSFGLRVSASGRKTWQVMFRSGQGNGKQRRVKLGSWPAMTLKAARDEARGVLLSAARGEFREKGAAPLPANLTVAEAVQKYLDKYAIPNTRDHKETTRILNKELVAVIGSVPVKEVRTEQVRDILFGIKERGAHLQANRTLSWIKALWSWLMANDYAENSPASRLKAPSQETQRDRVLKDEEIVWFWNGCGSLGWPFGPIFKLLLLTAQRRGEIAGLRWDDIDHTKQKLTLPAERTKSNRLNEVPLTAFMLDLISQLPRDSGSLVFSTTGVTAVSGYSKAKARLEALMRDQADETVIPHWTLHDLRRTVTSRLVENQVSETVADRLLNHKTGPLGGVHAVYNRYGYWEEKQQAMQIWSDFIQGLVGSDAKFKR